MAPLKPVLLLLALLAVALAHAEPPEGYVSEVLDNGLRVSILPDPSSTVVATQVWYHVGAANEAEHERGLAHLFEHLMFGATAIHGKQDYAEVHHIHGGEDNAYTSIDETVYTSAIAPEAHLEVMAFEADRMRNLVLDTESLDNEKRIVMEELRLRTENDPLTRAFVAAQRALLDGHPYAVDPSGTPEDIAAVTLEACRRFYDAHYQPDRAHLVVVGPVDTRLALRTARRVFTRIPPGGVAPPDVPPLIDRTFPPEVELSEDIPPVEGAILGFPLPPADSTDHWALLVLEQLLSGQAVDPFEQELVQRRHKAVQAGTVFLSFRRGGAVAFYSASLPYRRKKTAFRLMEETRAHLSRLEWLTEASLAAAKRRLLRDELRATFYPEERAMRIGQAQWWQGDERLAFSRASRIEQVGRDEVAAAYRKYIGEAAPVRLYLRPEHVPLWVRLFGWLYPLVGP
jgi:zinc protease